MLLSLRTPWGWIALRAQPWAGDATPGVSLCLLTWQSLHLSPRGASPGICWGLSCAWSRALQEQNQEILPIKWGISCIEMALTPNFWVWVFGQETQQLLEARSRPLHCNK